VLCDRVEEALGTDASEAPWGRREKMALLHKGRRGERGVTTEGRKNNFLGGPKRMPNLRGSRLRPNKDVLWHSEKKSKMGMPIYD